MKKLCVVFILGICGYLFGETLNVNYDVPDADISIVKNQLVVNYSKDFGQITTPGKYMLPSKQINILIPPNKSVISHNYYISTSNKDFEYLPQINSPYHDDTKSSSSSIKPEIDRQLIYLGEGYWNNLHYLRFRFAPYRYRDGVLTKIENISFSIELNDIPRDNSIVSLSLAEKAIEYFVNPELTYEYNTLNTRQQTLHVVTTQAIYDNIQDYLAFRMNQGFTINFGDIDFILENFGGNTSPDVLRNYLINSLNPASDNYLLLIGDFNTIPIKYLNASPNEDSMTPSDFYYSDLTSNFNSDGDDFWGEYSYEYGVEDYEIDFTPEMYVGRIPFSDPVILSQVMQRLIDFEQNDAPWKNSVLTPMAMFNFENEDYEIGWNRTDGSDFAEYLKNTVLRDNNVTTMYEQFGYDNSPYPSDFDLNSLNLQTALNFQDFGFVCIGAHGSPTSSSRLVWDDDFDDNNICTVDERYWDSLINVDMLNNITNQDGSIFFTQSCLNGAFDLTNPGEPSLGQYLLQKKGVAAITATRTGWYKIGWINPGWGGIHSLNYYLMENYYTHNQSLGMAHANANLLFSNYFFFGDPYDTEGIVWPEQKNIYTYLLYGDPLINYQPDYSLADGEILVWEPIGFGNSYNVVNAISESGNWNIYYTDKIDDEIETLDNFSAVFCLFGFQDEAYNLDSSSYEHELLTSYLQNGGKVYSEGSSSFSEDIPYYNYFNIWAPFDHVVNIDTVESTVSGQTWDYESDLNGFQALEIMQPDALTQNVYIAPQENYYDVTAIKTVYLDAIAIGASFPMSGLTDNLGSLTDYITEVLYTHFNIHSPQDNEESIQVKRATLSVYPNPALDMISFKTANTKRNSEVQIFNIRGQLVQSLNIGDSSKINWNIKDKTGKKLSNGVYFSRLKGERDKPVKFLILK